ncbi:hypothetical protein F5972_26180 [Microbispora cellulosiformans]|uniref:Uncharacterized protein n=1 Tax=Microbispora cellulosiformans TaxID=2614688 RepID=A0A5J5JZ08_9ACTN|nr:hypothetical protein [Microbispora cellulosiformans]KAA9375685.1 hypothetical protein F5972_26180 [Microbispora cellulosiformans]
MPHTEERVNLSRGQHALGAGLEDIRTITADIHSILEEIRSMLQVLVEEMQAQRAWREKTSGMLDQLFARVIAKSEGVDA